MYERFFGLTDRPFEIGADPRFLYLTPRHNEALCNLQYAIAARKPIAVLHGPAGTGKTTMINAAIDSFADRPSHVLHVSNPVLRPDELFEHIANEFGLSSSVAKSKTRFLRNLREALSDLHAREGVAALVVDEAHTVPDALWEEIRLLANVDTRTQALLPIVLAGQPELAVRLGRPDLVPLKQRIALRCTLAPFSPEETAAYVGRRIEVAGGRVDEVFTQEAIAAIHQHAHGIPRTISVICDNALITGLALQQRPVNQAVVLEVCREFEFAPEAPSRAVAVAASPEAPAAGRSSLLGRPVPVPHPSSAGGTPAAPQKETEARPEGRAERSVPERGMFAQFTRPRRFLSTREREA